MKVVDWLYTSTKMNDRRVYMICYEELCIDNEDGITSREVCERKL